MRHVFLEVLGAGVDLQTLGALERRVVVLAHVDGHLRGPREQLQEQRTTQ